MWGQLLKDLAKQGGMTDEEIETLMKVYTDIIYICIYIERAGRGGGVIYRHYIYREREIAQRGGGICSERG